jgi:Abortive infection C-terminus
MVETLPNRLDALLPRNSSAYRLLKERRKDLLGSPSYSSEAAPPEAIVYLLQWKSILLEVLNELDPEGKFREERHVVQLVLPGRSKVASAALDAALSDAEFLLRTVGAPRVVDRMHTALSYYLRAVSTESSIPLNKDASLTESFKVLREHHPALKLSNPRGNDIERILRSCAAILDALNPVRNLASAAHANEQLLSEPEALLVINVTRSLLAYFEARIRHAE